MAPLEVLTVIDRTRVLAEPWSFMDGEIDLTWAPGIGRSDTSFGAMIGY